MRGTGDDFRVDPFAQPKARQVGLPAQTPMLIAHQKAYLFNKLTLASHSYCSKQCLTLDSASADDGEQKCFSSCLSQYSASMNMLLDQTDKFKKSLADIRLNGGDIYAARDI